MRSGRLILLLLPCLWQCQPKQEESDSEVIVNKKLPGQDPSPYMISTFLEATSISFTNKTDDLASNNNSTRLGFAINGNRLNNPEEIRKTIGDNGGRYFSTIGPISAIINSFDSIVVISDEYYNTISPGNPLNDIIYLRAGSCYPWLQKKEGLDYCDFSKPISEITELDLYLMAPYAELEFTQLPEIKEHNITVTMTDDDKSFSATGHFVFH